MKKLLLSAIFLLGAGMAQAQLKVDSIGRTRIGAVLLKKGNLDVYSNKGITINNSFDAKLGTTLTISPSQNNEIILFE